MNASEESIFNEAFDQKDPGERSAYLGKACGADAALRKRVELLLSAYGSGEFLESPVLTPAATTEQTAERIGTVVGRYKLLEQIGEGGMGVVYVAEQTEPVRRRVALKIIKPGMDTKQVIARFEAERQALAMMDHPNIARILDAGTTGEETSSQEPVTSERLATGHRQLATDNWPLATGSRPYFVMELVRGMSISEYCDKARLSPRQRLELFIDVCQAVQHAHQKGIIHRDLKPSNVLITLHDGAPVVKVIDFGVAKAVGQQLTERTVYTALSQLVGTPLYMSPEQAEMSGLDVDTRSDVYSLGVLLYELLTGTTPFDNETLKTAGIDEIRRMIREDEPETVSARIAKTRRVGCAHHSSSSEMRSAECGMQNRDKNPKSKIENLKSFTELDWIAMKALEKDRTRRYESASALAADIQRYLSDEPVLACPPTTMYRFQKFARKHQPALATAAALALCLLLGTTVSAWQAVRATTAETTANANATEAQEKAQEANQQRDEAQRQRDEVKALADKLAAKDREMQRTLYTAHVNLARHAWDEGSADQVINLLEQHRPKPGEADLRNFEWHYLYRLCQSELLTLKGHTGGVRSVAYSPDGKRLASGSHDKTVKIWDSESGREILTFKGHTMSVSSVAFSPDGKRIASGTEDYEGRKPLPGEVEVWDSETGRELYSIAGLAHPVMSVAFDPTGQRLASAGGLYITDRDASEVKVWDVATGNRLFDLKGHQGAVESVVFSPDGKRLATADWYNNTKLWDADTGHALFSSGGGGKLSFSLDGARLAIPGWIMDVQTGKPIESVNRYKWRVNPAGMIYSPDGKRLADMANHQPVRILDAETGEELFTLKRRTSIREVAFSPDGKRLAMPNRDGTVSIVDALHPPDDRTIGEHNGTVFHVAYSSDGKRLVSASNDKTIKVWDVHSGKNLLTIQVPRRVWTAAISPDGKRIASASKVWDATTGEIIFQLQDDEQAGAVFSPDGKRLAAGESVWDAQTGQKLFTIGEGRMAKAFSPDGSLLFAGGRNPIAVFDALTGQELYTLSSIGRSGPGMTVGLSPDGRRIASASADGTVRVLDVKTGDELLSLKGFSGGVQGVAFSPDGKRIAAQSTYRMLKVWDAETGQEMLSLKSGFGHGIAFSPDGHQIAAAGDRCLKIWDATPLPEKP